MNLLMQPPIRLSASDLGHWYANPPDDTALATTSKNPLPNPGDDIRCLQTMIERSWQGHSTEAQQRALMATSKSPLARALGALIHGQLLMARRLEGAHQALDLGFQLGIQLFTPSDYLKVWKRHQQLKALPLFDKARPAQDLPSLLNEAKTIALIQDQVPHGRVPKHRPSKHRDTMD